MCVLPPLSYELAKLWSQTCNRRKKLKTLTHTFSNYYLCVCAFWTTRWWCNDGGHRQISGPPGPAGAGRRLAPSGRLHGLQCWCSVTEVRYTPVCYQYYYCILHFYINCYHMYFGYSNLATALWVIHMLPKLYLRPSAGFRIQHSGGCRIWHMNSIFLYSAKGNGSCYITKQKKKNLATAPLLQKREETSFFFC